MGICEKCGKPIAEGATVCTACGQSAVPTMAPLTIPAPPAAVAEDTSNVGGLGAFVGLIALFGVPVIGLIAAVIFSFAPKNKSIKNFARAALIWLVIGAVCVALLISAAVAALNLAMGAIGGALGKEFTDVGDLFSYASGVYEDVGGTLDQLGEAGITPDKIAAYADLLEDVREAGVTPKEFVDVWTQYQNGELSNSDLVRYGDLLEDATEAGLSPDQLKSLADQDLGALADQYGGQLSGLLP